MVELGVKMLPVTAMWDIEVSGLSSMCSEQVPPSNQLLAMVRPVVTP